ncbi:DUF3105 domain-containing protein [Arthrobacter sp. CC3]|uniref:DUF3105 domain-containing protein n=1 Tax=Arthrobacter sp. CC3 TaxID=3029185 RepID=UPI0032647DA1
MLMGSRGDFLGRDAGDVNCSFNVLNEQAALVTATAWGSQLAVQDAGDTRIAAFIRADAQSPKAPKPGAPCTGGTNN